MGLWSKLLGKKPTGGLKHDGSTYFCFVYSNNRSVIASLFQALRSEGPEVPAGHFMIRSSYRLWEKHKEPEANNLLFAGIRFLDTKETTVQMLSDALGPMGVVGEGELHVVFAAPSGEMYPKTRLVYQKMLEQAVRQGIMPFRMLVTQRVDAAQFLLDCFEPVTSSFAGSRLEDLTRI